MNDRITVFGEHEDRVLEQVENCIAVEEGARAVLCADGHLGYSQSIGAAVAYKNHISPSGVGYDIGCGNKAVRTNLRIEEIDRVVPTLMDAIFNEISFGIGRNNSDPVDHEVLDHIREARFEPQRQLLDMAARQLGTVGAGNHYVDLFRDEEGYVWVGVHFGSRGFGHKTASGFLAMAAEDEYRKSRPDIPWTGSIEKHFMKKGSEGEMMSPPIVFSTDSGLGQSYIEAMTLAGEYAYAGRDVVVEKVLQILGAKAVEEVHNHHNFAWREEHDGEFWWVVRKGCTPAFPGQKGFVGATMGEDSVILEGTETAEKAMFSTVHGAGRAMSRTQAAGKVKRRKRYQCSHRDCERVFNIDGVSAHNAAPKKGICPDHPEAGLRKIFINEQIRPGVIDFDQVRQDLIQKRIVLRGGAADEAPGAYKRLDEVLAAHGDMINVLHRLTPIGVAMAGSDVVDPFKD